MTDTSSDWESVGDRVVPAWLANLAAVGWRVIVVVALGYVVVQLGATIWTTLAAIGLAILVAVILAPLMVRLRNGGMSRTSAALRVWAATIGAGLAVLVLLGISLIPSLVNIVRWLQEGQEELEALIAEQGLPDFLADFAAEVFSSLSGISGDAVGEAISDAVGSLANLTGILILGTFLLFFFLRDGDKAWGWLFQWIDEEKRERIDSAGDTALSRVGDFVRGTTVLATIAAATNFLFMVVLGTPLALALAVFTFVTAYVPYFGGIISAYFIIIVTWAAAGVEAALVMAVLIFIRFLAVRLLVRPRVHSNTFTLHPVVILIALPIGFQVGGVAGLVLAVPLTAVVLSTAQSVAFVIEPAVPRNLPEMVPAWLDAAAQWSWRSLVVLVFVGILVVILTTLPLVILPIIVALILAATVAPFSEVLLKRGWSRTSAVATAVGGSTFAIVGVLALALVSIAQQAEEIGSTASSGADDIDEAAGGLLGAGTDAIEAGVDVGVGVVADLTNSLGPLAVILVLSVLLTFFFLRDGAKLWHALMSHLPKDAATELSSAGGRAFAVLGGYMVGTGAISLVGAGSQAVIMWVLGLPLVMPIFVLSFFGGFIPYIGSALTTVLAFLVAVAVGDTIDIVVMAIWTLVFNIVQGNVVAPLVYNRTTHIHPAIVLACIPAASSIAGILGMFLVVPVLGVVIVTWRSVIKLLGTDLGEPVTFDEEDEDQIGPAESTEAPAPG